VVPAQKWVPSDGVRCDSVSCHGHQGRVALRGDYAPELGARKSVNRELEAKTRALAGWKGLHHQPRRPARRLRHRRLPPALAHREGLSDVQARSAGSADLPPHPRLHRGPPERRIRRDSRLALDRVPNRLEHQEIRQVCTPLPHRHHPSRQPDPHRRRTPTARPRRNPSPHQPASRQSSRQVSPPSWPSRAAGRLRLRCKLPATPPPASEVDDGESGQ